MLSLVMKYPNVFIDTSAYKVGRYPEDLVDYMRASKSHKVLFGSNHPFWPAGDCIVGLDKLGLGEKATALFLADNAKSVFKLS
jgi:predicted TIM-barrel fold metal-dependent hydrolase